MSMGNTASSSLYECDLFGCHAPRVSAGNIYCREHADSIGAELGQFRMWLTGHPGLQYLDDSLRPDEASDQVGRFDVDRVTL